MDNGVSSGFSSFVPIHDGNSDFPVAGGSDFANAQVTTRVFVANGDDKVPLKDIRQTLVWHSFDPKYGKNLARP